MPVCVRLANNSYDDDDEDGTLDRLDPDEDTPGEDDLIKVDFLFSVPLFE